MSRGRATPSTASREDRWYRSRTIQAALVTGVFMLITTVVTLVPSVSRKGKGTTDSQIEKHPAAYSQPSEDSAAPSREDVKIRGRPDANDLGSRDREIGRNKPAAAAPLRIEAEARQGVANQVDPAPILHPPDARPAEISCDSASWPAERRVHFARISATWPQPTIRFVFLLPWPAGIWMLAWNRFGGCCVRRKPWWDKRVDAGRI